MLLPNPNDATKFGRMPEDDSVDHVGNPLMSDYDADFMQEIFSSIEEGSLPFDSDWREETMPTPIPMTVQSAGAHQNLPDCLGEERLGTVSPSSHYSSSEDNSRDRKRYVWSLLLFFVLLPLYRNR